MADPAPNWRPIIEGDLARRAAAAVENIAADLMALGERGHTLGPSMGVGDAGIGLFFHYLHLSRAVDGYAGASRLFMDRAFEDVARASLWYDLFQGVTGVAWVHHHIYGFSNDGDDLEEVDDQLVKLLDKEKWPLLYDLITGLAGIGVYALERWPHGRSGQILESVVRHLLAALEPATPGATIFTPPHLLVREQRGKYPHGYYNLGVAHGIPAVTAVLAAAGKLGVKGSRSPLEAARQTAQWLLACRQERPAASSFPSIIALDGKHEPTRLGWCYGDGGVAGLLLAVSRMIGDEELAGQAEQIAQRAMRIPEEGTRVADAPLCHGATGLAHIFNRFFQATGDETYRDAARFWIERALAFHRPGQGVGGFQANRGEEWDDFPGFLEGAAGVGLALLAAIHAVEPAWDRLLLLSMAV